jgi:hypothetical protein
VVGGAESNHHRRHVVARIAVGRIAADRPDIANLRIGDLQRRLAQDRHLLREKLRRYDIVLAVHRPDDDIVAVLANPAKIAYRGEVDEMCGCSEPELHDRDHAVAAGERTGVLAEIGKQRDRVLHGFGAMVFECAWNHGSLPAAGSGSPPVAPPAHPH